MLHQFDTKDPAEKIVLPFDFSRDLDGETLSLPSVVVTITLRDGTETPTPTLVTWGSPSTANGIVYVGVQAGAHFNDYDVACKVTTNTGRILVLSGVVPVRTA